MLHYFFVYVYWVDLGNAAAILAALVIAWSVLSAVFEKKMRNISAAAAAVIAGIILYITVFSRGGVAVDHELTPFSMFIRAIGNPLIFRSLMMNVFLFVPFGMTLPFVIQSTAKRTILFSVLIGFSFSCAIELMQYFMQAGMAQTDDVICNTIGMGFGVCAYPLSLLWKKQIKNRKATENGSYKLR